MNTKNDEIKIEDNAKGGDVSEEKATLSPRISYDDFAKLEIKIGIIQSVEIVENADKLLKLSVDVGDVDGDGVAAPRQIISGIREYFDDVQFLVGKQCPFLTNLEPRIIRGLESQGMILAASHDDIFSLLIPHNQLPSGTRVV